MKAEEHNSLKGGKNPVKLKKQIYLNIVGSKHLAWRMDFGYLANDFFFRSCKDLQGGEEWREKIFVSSN